MQKNSLKEMCTTSHKRMSDHADPLLEPKFLIDEMIEVKDNGHEGID